MPTLMASHARQIGLQGVPVTCGRHTAQHRVQGSLLPEPLGGPEQERQLVQCERLGAEVAAALAVADGRRQGHGSDTVPLADWRQAEQFGVGWEGLFQGRRWYAPVLIGP